MSEVSFQQLLFDSNLSNQTYMPPYFPDPYPDPILQNISNPTLGQVSSFRKIRECAINLNYITKLDNTNNL